MTDYLKYQSEVLNCCQKLVNAGILIATGGNVSVRVLGEDKIAITPSNKDYTLLSAKDICVLDFDGNQVAGPYKPSIEHRFHIEIYRNRLDVGGVVHTHQPNISVFSLIKTSIPALFDEQVFRLGETIDLISYAPSGTNGLVENIIKKLKNRSNAYIMENHGVLILGGNLEDATLNSMVAEKVAIAYLGAIQTSSRISELPQESVELFAKLYKERQVEYMKRHKDTYKH